MTTFFLKIAIFVYPLLPNVQHSEAVFPLGWPFRAEKLLFIRAWRAPDGPGKACQKNDHYFLKEERFFLKEDRFFLKEKRPHFSKRRPHFSKRRPHFSKRRTHFSIRLFSTAIML
jgi:hypothetical protein